MNQHTAELILISVLHCANNCENDCSQSLDCSYGSMVIISDKSTWRVAQWPALLHYMTANISHVSSSVSIVFSVILSIIISASYSSLITIELPVITQSLESGTNLLINLPIPNGERFIFNGLRRDKFGGIFITLHYFSRTKNEQKRPFQKHFPWYHLVSFKTRLIISWYH